MKTYNVLTDKMRNPEGEIVDVDSAINSWNELARPLEELGFKVHGYSPGVSFYSPTCRAQKFVIDSP